MKFRTDFVTNSSSTSYISVLATYLDGTSSILFCEDEDSGCGALTLEVPEQNLNKTLKATNLEELEKAYYALYEGTDQPFIWCSDQMFEMLRRINPNFKNMKSLEICSFEHYPNDDYDEDEPVKVYMQIIKFDPQSGTVSCEHGKKEFDEVFDN